jgi:signal transduction histidine kinase
MTNSSRLRVNARDAHAEEAFALRDLRARLDRFGPTRLLLALDLAALVLIAAAYLQLGPPELLFHGVFVALTLDAFFFGRRVTYERIVVSSIALLGYVALPALEAGVEPLDLTEWPLMFAIAILVAWMADRERTAVRRYAGLYRSARDRLVTAQEEERRRLSRDLHDGIGQTLTALTLSLDSLGDPASDATLERARRLAGTALDEARTVAERVRPPRLEERGLASAVHEMAVRCGVPVVMDIDPSAAADLPANHVIEVYRIAQEAVGNAVRHARASEIEVRIALTGNDLRLIIADDGIGFDPREEHPGLGLTGMRERAALMGGRLRIASQPRGGTRIELRVPTVPAVAPIATAREPVAPVEGRR